MLSQANGPSKISIGNAEEVARTVLLIGSVYDGFTTGTTLQKSGRMYYI